MHSHLAHGAGVVRVGSLCLNHPELVQKHPLHTLLFLCWCGSCRFAVLEPPELEQKHPTHLASSVMVWFV